MDKGLIAIILSTLSIFLLIFLFKKTNDKIDNIEIPSHSQPPPALTGNGPSGLNETEVIELIRAHSSSGGGTTIIQESGEDGYRNASSTELGYEVSVTGHKLELNKNPIINAWSGMIVPFRVNFNTDEGKVQITELQRAGWFLCDGRNGTPDLRGRFIWGGGEGGDRGEGSTHAGAVLLDNDDYNRYDETGGTGHEILSENQMPRHKHSSPIRDIGYCTEGHSWYTPNGTDIPEKCSVAHNGNYLVKGTGGYLQETGYFDARHPDSFDQSGNHTEGIGGKMIIEHGTTVNHGNAGLHMGFITFKDGKYTGGTHKTDFEDRDRGGPANGEKINNLPPYVVMAYFIYLPHKAI